MVTYRKSYVLIIFTGIFACVRKSFAEALFYVAVGRSRVLLLSLIFLISDICFTKCGKFVKRLREPDNIEHHVSELWLNPINDKRRSAMMPC